MPIDRKSRIRLVSDKYQFHGLPCLLQRWIIEPALRIDGCEARAKEQWVTLA